jgi:hypothetical protein
LVLFVALAALAGSPFLGSARASSFEPTLTVTAGAAADSPNPLRLQLELVPEGEPGLELSAVDLTLPRGLSLDPSGFPGLQGCSPAQAGLTSPPRSTPAIFDAEPATCPTAARLGTLEIGSSLAHPLSGALYLATPGENPFGATFGFYAVLEEPEAPFLLKLAGRLTPDPATGQLSASFPEIPDLPVSSAKLEIPGGPQGLLTSPPTCGEFAVAAKLTPSTGEALAPTGSFAVSEGPGGTACAATEAAEPNRPGFAAATLDPAAGAFSPFFLRITREAGSQPLAAIAATLPPGLLGRLAGIEICSEAQIAGAEARGGEGGATAELAAPSCPASSQVGTIDVASGSGEPLRTSGRVYLAGPYKGAPLSVVSITPALAGPFDLGAVVDRVASYVNPITTQIEPVTDTVPTIVDGVPLDLRSVDVELNRPEFTLNPTNCNPLATVGSLTSSLGQSVAVSSPFQAIGCQALPFHPKLKIKLSGATRRTGSPALSAVITALPGEANSAYGRVTLPPSEFVDNAHFGDVCTNVQFNAGPGNGAECPRRSVYGRARVFTPLLAAPEEGLVYLRSNPEPGLPNLVVALHGPADQPIAIDLVGKIDSAKSGGLRTTFSLIPDAAISRFELHMDGGKKGLLENSKPLCARRTPKHAIVDLTGQNGKRDDYRTKVEASCRKRHSKSSKASS